LEFALLFRGDLRSELAAVIIPTIPQYANAIIFTGHNTGFFESANLLLHY